LQLNIRPLSPRVGAQILDLDPRSEFDGATVEALRAALAEHRVLLFRALPLNEEEQVRLTQVAGVPTFRGYGNYTDPTQKSSLVSNAHKEGLFGDGELSFHSDLSFTPHILKARSLHALTLPSYAGAGGETLFSDVQAAYDELDPELKARVEPLQARFAATYTFGEREEVVAFVRPLIGTHPQTGRRFIAASRAVTKEVIGMERSEFRPLLKALWAHMEQPRYVYRHTWQLGDTLFWDNIAVQHARTPFDPKEKRALRAVSVDDPAIAVQAAPVAQSAAAQAS
jgi:alpha-ketoglutarate-dependent taurine dioxygenase